MSGMASKFVCGLSSRLSHLSVMPTYGSSALLPSCTFATNAHAGPPKRPIGPFLVFANQERPQLQRENPDLAIKDLGRILGERYNALSDSKKEAMKVEYGSAMKEYKVAMEAFKATEAGKQYFEEQKKAAADKKLAKEKQAKKKLKSDLGKPKQPMNAYMLFNNAQIDPSKPVAPQGKKIAETWKSMSEAEKMPYLKKYSQLKEQYEKDMASWKASLSKEDQEKLGLIKEKKPAKAKKAK